MKRLTAIISSSLLAVALTGCGKGGISDDYDFGGNSGSYANDTLKVISQNGNDFTVKWTKASSDYGEVIYTDDLSKTRGDGYPFTANGTGDYYMPCEYRYEDSSAAYFKCHPDTVTYSVYVKLKKGKEYKWLVSTGFAHNHQPVAFKTKFENGTLTIY